MTSPLPFHELPPGERDAAYNNGAHVSNSGQLLDDLRRRSDAFRAAHPEHLDLRYGPEERNRIDYFAAAGRGPVLVFIHGGYWQSPRTKENVSVLAAGPLAHGLHVVFIGYTLAPQKRLTGIVSEAKSALAWIATHAGDFGGDGNEIYVAGWSAGGHLTASVLHEPGVRGGLAISGVFDLEPIRYTYINEKLQLDAEEAARLSPIHHLPVQSRPLVLAYGTAELPAIQRQSERFGALRAEAGLPGRIVPLPRQNHFTILDEMTSADGELTKLVCELAGRPA